MSRSRHHAAGRIVTATLLALPLLNMGCAQAAKPAKRSVTPSPRVQPAKAAASGPATDWVIKDTDERLGLRAVRRLDAQTIRLSLGPSFVVAVGEMASSYRIVSPTDAAFKPGLRAVKAVHVATPEPAPDGWAGKTYERHTVTLTLPKPMKSGHKYWVQVLGGGQYHQPTTGGRAAGWIVEMTDAAEQRAAETDALGVGWVEMVAPSMVQITVGDGFDAQRFDGHPETIVLTSADDPDFQGGRPAVKAGRRTRGAAFYPDGWPYGFYEKHELFAVFDKPLKQGHSYSVDLNAAAPLTCGNPKSDLLVSDKSSVNPAIKVNQVGYLPNAKSKYAYYGDWMGSLGALDTASIAKSFEVRDAKTNAVVLSGPCTLRHKSGDKNEGMANLDLSGENVMEMDLSALAKPGTYYVAIPGAGRSYAFRIADDVYAGPYSVMMNGILHQRCGMELKPPYAEVYRAACHRNRTQLTDLPHGSESDAFANLPKHVIDPKKYDLYGGYHDAGDYNPHSHIGMAEMAFLLYETKPGAFYDGQGNVPEANNGVPDILDAGRWELDLWTRLQDTDGGVRDGIEAGGDPDMVTLAEEDTIPEYAFAKDAGASLRYAAVAAQAAYLWGGLGKKADAKAFLAHALKAWDWAFAHGGAARTDMAARAAIQLYRVTGEKKYLDEFAKDSIFSKKADSELEAYQQFDQRDASFYYAICQRPTDAVLKDRIVAAFKKLSDDWSRPAETVAYRYLKHPYAPNTWGTGAHPKWLIPMIQSYVLTHDPNSLRWIALTCDYALGCNPMNTVYTTRLGQNPIRHPLHMLSMYSPEAPIAGIQAEGPSAQEGGGKAGSSMGSWIGAMLYPAGQWPELQTYSDVTMSPGMNEGIVVDQMATAAAYGFLLPEHGAKRSGR